MSEGDPNNVADLLSSSIASTSADFSGIVDIKLTKIKGELSSEFQKSLEALKEVILQRVIEDNCKLRKRLRSLENEVDEIYDKIFELEKKVEANDQHHRRETVELHGIPIDLPDEELEDSVIKLLNNVVDVPIKREEVVACHRIGGKAGIKGTVIRFVNRRRSEEIKEKRDRILDVDMTTLKYQEGSKVYINDNLNPYFKTLAYKCRQLKKMDFILAMEIYNGRIRIKRNSGKWFPVDHNTVLMNMFPEIDFDSL